MDGGAEAPQGCAVRSGFWKGEPNPAPLRSQPHTGQSGSLASFISRHSICQASRMSKRPTKGLPTSEITFMASMAWAEPIIPTSGARSEEHTSELQSRPQLVCRLLLEKKKGTVGCHSQMVRPFRSEVERYGEYSKSGD